MREKHSLRKFYNSIINKGIDALCEGLCRIIGEEIFIDAFLKYNKVDENLGKCQEIPPPPCSIYPVDTSGSYSQKEVEEMIRELPDERRFE